MDGRVLDYVALGILIFVCITIIYGIIFIHDIPYEIAKKRNHPHMDAIHTAGWVSLFLMHTIWPFLWIWATLYKPGLGWGIARSAGLGETGSQGATSEDMKNRLIKLEQEQITLQDKYTQNMTKLTERIAQLEGQISKEAEK